MPLLYSSELRSSLRKKKNYKYADINITKHLTWDRDPSSWVHIAGGSLKYQMLPFVEAT